MNIRLRLIQGFTLIEVAIVLIVLTILLGYTMAMVPAQQELKQYRQADVEMDKIIDALYAYAQTKGHLPCPAADASNGLECRDNNATDGDCDVSSPAVGSCDVWFGYVPGKALGLNGRYRDNLLRDPWGQAYRYAVTNVDDGGAAAEDFVMPDGMKQVGINALNPDLTICNADPTPSGVGPSDTACASADQTVFGASSVACSDADVDCSPAIILSLGKDFRGNTVGSWVQRENLDGDIVYIKTTRDDSSSTKYDDIVKWISPNILYSKMIAAEKLP
jgi:prepilin-type N-terminal cleavage/methylation domain-containing protein